MEEEEKKMCEEIYNNNYQKVLWYLRKNFTSLNEEDYFDIMQDVWGKLSSHIESVGKRNKNEQQAWIMAVTTNQAITYIRNRIRDTKLEERLIMTGKKPFYSEAVDSMVIEKMLAIEVMGKLSEKDKKELFALYCDSEEQESMNNVHLCRRYRARKKLMDIWKQKDM